MRRILVPLALLATIPALAKAQVCLGRPDGGHRLVNNAGHVADGFVRQSIGYAGRGGRFATEANLTEPTLWTRGEGLEYRAFDVLLAMDLWRRDSVPQSAGPTVRAPQAPRAARTEGNRWCLVTVMRERREPAPLDFDGRWGAPEEVDQSRAYETTRYHVALGWGRETGPRWAPVRPFALTGATFDLERLEQPDESIASRRKVGGFAQVGVGVTTYVIHSSVAVSYAPGLPDYSLVGRHNWLMLTFQLGMLF